MRSPRISKKRLTSIAIYTTISAIAFLVPMSAMGLVKLPFWLCILLMPIAGAAGSFVFDDMED